LAGTLFVEMKREHHADDPSADDHGGGLRTGHRADRYLPG